MTVRQGAGAAVLLVLMLVFVLPSRAAAPAQSRGGPPFVQEGQCYRIAFPIDGAPNYKVLEVVDGVWLRAEVDAGTAKAQRQSLWINSAQIVTMRQVRCSD